MKQHSKLRNAAILIFWITIWQLLSMIIHNSIILVGPADVLAALVRLAGTGPFWTSILHSFARIALGFLSAFLFGLILGSFSFRFPLFKEFLQPIILLMKAVPVASFIILALIWAGSKNLSVFISFVVVFPMIYVNTISGLESTDPKLLEMAQVFHIRLWKRIRFIYIPAIRPYLVSSCEIALGMAWKSGIAAEVIGTPASSIGERLYLSKIYLETGDLFAWTIVIILISASCEKMFLYLLKKGRYLE